LISENGVGIARFTSLRSCRQQEEKGREDRHEDCGWAGVGVEPCGGYGAKRCADVGQESSKRQREGSQRGRRRLNALGFATP
jgi:hypothetical protein